jgi:hypothetical protein
MVSTAAVVSLVLGALSAFLGAFCSVRRYAEIILGFNDEMPVVRYLPSINPVIQYRGLPCSRRSMPASSTLPIPYRKAN